MKIEVDDFVLRNAISHFEGFMKSPKNGALKTLCRLSLDNLKDHLPERIAEEERRVNTNALLKDQ
jgi:hypothetical protein